MKEFLIYAPPYDPNSGGCIVLHKLCDLINRSGRQAYIYPNLPSFELNAGNWADLPRMKEQIDYAMNLYDNFTTNPSFITPVIKPEFAHFASDDQIIIYPEITFGNPLKAKNIIRWMLYYPGFHTGKVYFSPNELHYLYNSTFGEGHDFPTCKRSNTILNIRHLPIDIYNKKNKHDRSGTAYCLRKQKNYELMHDQSDSICIDGKSHEEIAEIFSKIKTFISYDPCTAYSAFAVLSGCDSIIVPSDQHFEGHLMERNGIAYGFNDLQRASNTRHLLVESLLSYNTNNTKLIEIFIRETDQYFK